MRHSRGKWQETQPPSHLSSCLQGKIHHLINTLISKAKAKKFSKFMIIFCQSQFEEKCRQILFTQSIYFVFSRKNLWSQFVTLRFIGCNFNGILVEIMFLTLSYWRKMSSKFVYVCICPVLIWRNFCYSNVSIETYRWPIHFDGKKLS